MFIASYMIGIIVSFVLFVIYNMVAIANFGIPESLSNTFYLFNQQKDGKGYMFTALMVGIVMLIVIPWIEVTEVLAPDWTWLCFIAVSCMCFVGCAPWFKDGDLENHVHCYAAILGAVCAMAWVLLVAKMWLVVAGVAVSIGVLAYLTSSVRSGLTYWLEMVAFLSLYVSLPMVCCM